MFVMNHAMLVMNHAMFVIDYAMFVINDVFAAVLLYHVTPLYL